MKHKSLALKPVYDHEIYKQLIFENKRLKEIKSETSALNFLEACLLPFQSVYGASRFYGEGATAKSITLGLFYSGLVNIRTQTIVEAAAFILNGLAPKLGEYPFNHIQFHEICRTCIPEPEHVIFKPEPRLQLEAPADHVNGRSPEELERAQHYKREMDIALGRIFVNVNPDKQHPDGPPPKPHTVQRTKRFHLDHYSKLTGKEVTKENFAQVLRKVWTVPGENRMPKGYIYALEEFNALPD